MPELLRSASTLELAFIVLASFVGMTAIAVAAGFAAERAFRHERIFAVPLAKGQYRFELIGNVVFLARGGRCGPCRRP